jgi:hypothetical protein
MGLRHQRGIRSKFCKILQNPVAGITRSTLEIPAILARMAVALTGTAGSFQINPFRFAGRIDRQKGIP